MRSIFFGLSVHHYITTVGADAGFAALIGLAILVLLYFAQARETSSIREQAAQSAERVQQLEARLAALRPPGEPSAPASAAATMVPAPLANAVPPASPATVGPQAPVSAPSTAATSPEPAAPAGVGAPALAAATRLIPIAPSPVSAQTSPSPVTAAATAVAERPIDDTVMGALPPATPAGETIPARPPPGPIPARPAAASNGIASKSVGATANHRGGSAPPPSKPPRVQGRPGGNTPTGPRSAAPTGVSRRRGSSRRSRRGLIALLVGLLVAGGVAVVVVVTSSGGRSRTQAASPTSTANSIAPRRNARPVALNVRSVKIAVLNGTAKAGLAAQIASKLAGHGYTVATTTNAADQTHTATVVAYLPSQRRAALAVAQSLGLGPASVQLVDQSTQAIACPATSSCAITVVVTAGDDLASST